MAAIDCSANQPPAAVCWGDLPDPRDPQAPAGARTQILLDCDCWQHVLSKHVLARREPWRDIFSDELLGRLVGLVHPPGFADPVVAQAIDRLGRQALERPLALLHEVRRPDRAGKAPSQRWVLVLPSGATALVHESKKRNRLATCYFPSYAAVTRNRARRWLDVVACLVLRYGIFDTRRNALLLPTVDTVIPVPPKGPAKQLHAAIRFVTPTSWGFCPELNGCPWRGRPPDWPAAETWAPSPRYRLKPRGRPPNEEDSTP